MRTYNHSGSIIQSLLPNGLQRTIAAPHINGGDAEHFALGPTSPLSTLTHERQPLYRPFVLNQHYINMMHTGELAVAIVQRKVMIVQGKHLTTIPVMMFRLLIL